MKKSSACITSRRRFLLQSATLLGAALLLDNAAASAFAPASTSSATKVNGHLWVYASKYPPNWDCTPDLETVFSDLSAAGIDGVELMEILLRHDDAVKNLNLLIKKYNLPVSGISYGAAMWDENQHKQILDDVKVIVQRLSLIKGKTFGISVGDARRLKTEKELDAQANLLKKILVVCKDYGIEPNLHNHTYEVVNGMHDLKGTLLRIPGIKLGPDLNWLIRGGIDPVDFIHTYGDQIVYLHIRDQDANGGWTEYLGQGVTDFAAIARALKAKKIYCNNVAVELAFPADFKPANPLKDDWKMSRLYVKKVFEW